MAKNILNSVPLSMYFYSPLTDPTRQLETHPFHTSHSTWFGKFFWVESVISTEFLMYHMDNTNVLQVFVHPQRRSLTVSALRRLITIPLGRTCVHGGDSHSRAETHRVLGWRHLLSQPKAIINQAASKSRSQYPSISGSASSFGSVVSVLCSSTI